MSKPSALDQIKSILALPFVVLVIIPILSILLIPELVIIPIVEMNVTTFFIIGILLAISGATLFIQSILLTVKIGKGTLAPWNPARKLVVVGLYRHVRNPMILGVVIILLAEALLFKSFIILLWSAIFFIGNHIHFKVKEEPDLLKRFGEEYLEYKRNVPRWLPLIKGWDPDKEKEQ